MEEYRNKMISLEKEYADKKCPRPDNWGGFNFKARKFEFWQEGEFRHHHRFKYNLTQDHNTKIEAKINDKTTWDIQQLYP